MAEIHPIKLEIYRNLFASIAQEMGSVLKRTAYSPNVKERRDYSCALFDGAGELVAMGDHMPVHLGSMPLSVKAAIEAFPLHPGDIAIVNDPFSGGTHLPDITLIAPVFETSSLQPIAYSLQPLFHLACRAHHSDVGGMSPGSMPLSHEIFQEGIRIPPLKLYNSGRLNRTLLRMLLYNVRTPVEREGDLAAQVGALKAGQKRLQELLEGKGRQELEDYMAALQEYAERRMRQIIHRIPDGTYHAEDYLDDDGAEERSKSRPVKLAVSIEVDADRLRIDFTGSEAQVNGCVNAVFAITQSAVFYVLRCLAADDVPNSAGLMRPVQITAPRGTVVNAGYPAATAGGNVETSQRIVDVLLKALAHALPDLVPAASSGTMNNLSIGGVHPASGRPFSYYETIGGGMGGGPKGRGDSGIHTHMTNSLNTPVEALERSFPFRVREYRLRSASGGNGRHPGGDGIIRSLEALTECHVTILSDRRRYSPYGLNGGLGGKKGLNQLIVKGRSKRIPGKVSLRIDRGEVISIESPGGGGWGKA
ncbi:MAG: hydantoinase B/oxoprolinase family protein [Acidobacteriota bacterium]